MRHVVTIAILGALGCGKSEVPAVRPVDPEPSPRVVYVVVTATPAPQDAVAAARAAAQALATPVPEATKRPALAQYSVPVAAGKPTPEQPYCVIQDFVTKAPDSVGDVWFDGDVVNLGSSPAKVVILVKAYSINRRLIDSETVYPRPYPIPSGQKAHFHSFVKAGGDQIRSVDPEVLPQ